MPPTDNQIHDEAVIRSEGQRQVDMAAAAAIEDQAAHIAAVRAADIAHHRRVVASGVATGIRTENAANALRELGAI